MLHVILLSKFHKTSIANRNISPFTPLVGVEDLRGGYLGTFFVILARSLPLITDA